MRREQCVMGKLFLPFHRTQSFLFFKEMANSTQPLKNLVKFFFRVTQSCFLTLQAVLTTEIVSNAMSSSD